MRTIVMATLVGWLLVPTTAALADCPRPRPTFQIPEGGSATAKDMAAANEELGAFGSKVRDYLYCLGGEVSQKSVGKEPAAREELQRAHVAAHEEAANELRGLVTCYKTQREIFESTGGGKQSKPADCSPYIAAAAQSVQNNDAVATMQLTVESSGHTFQLAGGSWLYYLVRDDRPRRCSQQQAAEECLYRAVHVRNDSDDVLECRGEITYAGTDSKGEVTARGQQLVSERAIFVVVESLAKQGIDAESFEARCTARPKLPALNTPANCKYEVIKPVSISDYYPPPSQDAGEEGPVIVEFSLSGKAARPTDVRVVAGSMYERLDQAAVKAVGDMVMSSSCGKSRYRLKLNFQLQQ